MVGRRRENKNIACLYFPAVCIVISRCFLFIICIILALFYHLDFFFINNDNLKPHNHFYPRALNSILL